MHFQCPPGPGLEARRVVTLYVGSLGGAAIALTATHAAVFAHARPEPSPFATFAATVHAPTEPGPSASSAPLAIAFQSPVPGEAVDSPFGLRRLPWEAAGRLHAGVDIAAPSGAPIHATADGVVAAVGRSPSYGRFVEIRHAGGLVSKYAHMGAHAMGLRAGLPIARGQVVGFVGNTGRSTGAHLHFEIRKGGRPLDPAQFVGRAFARLADLPITRAGHVPRRVRVAYVSRWPDDVSPPADEARPRVDAQPAPAMNPPKVQLVSRAGGRTRMVIVPTQQGVRIAAAGPREPAPYAALAARRDAPPPATLYQVSNEAAPSPPPAASQPAPAAGN